MQVNFFGVAAQYDLKRPRIRYPHTRNVEYLECSLCVSQTVSATQTLVHLARHRSLGALVLNVEKQLSRLLIAASDALQPLLNELSCVLEIE
jgi:hypothetical protein